MVLSYLGASDSCVCYFAVMSSQMEDALLTDFFSLHDPCKALSSRELCHAVLKLKKHSSRLLLKH